MRAFIRCVCVSVFVRVWACVFVGSYLTTKAIIYIGKLRATGSGWIIIKLATDEQVNYQQISYMTLMGGGALNRAEPNMPA